MIVRRDLLIGVVSDTHGTLDPRVTSAFVGVDLVLHAGDIGSVDVLLELETLGPVTAVLGNTDHAMPGFSLPLTATLDLAGVRLYMAHQFRSGDVRGLPPGTGVVVSGHTHVPCVDSDDGILFVNPGAAFRSRLPGGRRTVGLIEIRDGRATARIIEL